MGLFRFIHTVSISTNTAYPWIFWSVIVVVNASIGFLISIENRFNLIGVLSGILSWICIYTLLIAPIYRRQGIGLQKSLLIGYLAQISITFLTIIGLLLMGMTGHSDFSEWIIAPYMEIGIYSVGIIQDLISEVSRQGLVLAYTVTMLYGLILSTLYLVFGFLIYGLSLLKKRIR